MKHLFILLLTIFYTANFSSAQNSAATKVAECRFTSEKILIDGDLDDDAWQQTSWITDFEDIRGGGFPGYDTKVKLLYDSSFLYIAVQFDEPHICAQITENEKQIYLDNCFEFFLDIDDIEVNYYEFEINALGATWDLQMNKPYYKGGKPNSNWNIENLKKAIKINGSLNNPNDIDTCWNIELAIPFTSFDEYSCGSTPSDGAEWRMNLLRVEWDYDIANGKYIKKTDQNGKTIMSDFWVWSPQGKVDMHLPKRWGILQFKK